MSRVLIALGGNLGNVEETFSLAIAALSDVLRDIRMSECYRSAAVYDKPGCTEPLDPAPDYLDAVLCAQTDLSPQALLNRLLATEIQFGRVRPAPECSPRTLDLDLLLYDDLVIKPWNPGDLELPHPRMHERLFVLNPACDVAPEWIHPVLQQSLSSLRNAILTRNAAYLRSK